MAAISLFDLYFHKGALNLTRLRYADIASTYVNLKILGNLHSNQNSIAAVMNPDLNRFCSFYLSRGKRRKKRDESSSGLNEIDPRFDSEHPFLARINEIGFGQLRDSRDCQKQIFCEMSKFGATQENANTIQKIFHYLSLM